MEVNIFGFKFKREQNKSKSVESFSLPHSDDGAKVVDASYSALGYGFNYNFGADPSDFKEDENALIEVYRALGQEPEVEEAIENIINEAIVVDDDNAVVSLKLDNLVEAGKITEEIKKKIIKEFDKVLKLLNFKRQGQEWFRMWYIDGRIHFQKIIDKDNTKNGIREVRFIDPRHIRKIKEVEKVVDPETAIEMFVPKGEYFIYYDTSKDSFVTQPFAAKIYSDAIAFCSSGLTSPDNKLVLSYLHKAIRPMNMLKLLEDSMLIYRVTRAPQRRIFYVDIGEMPKQKAEQYIQNLAAQYKNKVSYNPSTGEIDTKANMMGLLEDLWLPRRDGSKGTEVATLEGGGELGNAEDYTKLRLKLQKSLQVPNSRMEGDSPFNMGRPSEISREELKFGRFIKKLRAKFNTIFDDLLGTQLILKNILTIDEWEQIKDEITYVYNSDSFFTELKDNDILKERIEMINQIDPYIGKYFPKSYVLTDILKFSDKEKDAYQKQIDIDSAEESEPRDMNADPLADPNSPEDETDTEEPEQENNESKNGVLND